MKGEKISEVYSRAAMYERVTISQIAKSSVRLKVIENHDRIDELCIDDIEDLVV